MERKVKVLDLGAAIVVIAASLVMIGCKQSVGNDSGVGTTPIPVSYDFVAISPSAAGIVGVEPMYSLLGMDEDGKGVFIKDRKVKLRPYSLGKTAVPYKLWKEVYEWATGNGYKFANKGKKGSNGTGSDDEPVTTVNSGGTHCMVQCVYPENQKRRCMYLPKKG